MKAFTAVVAALLLLGGSAYAAECGPQGPNGCIEDQCDPADPTRCLACDADELNFLPTPTADGQCECPPGESLTTDRIACVADCFVDNCDTCSPAGVDICATCVAGFTVQADGTCVADTPVGCDVANCLECVVDPATQEVTQFCDVCAPEFEATADGQCVPLPGPFPPKPYPRRPVHCRKGMRLVKGRCVRVHHRRPHHKRCKKGMRLVKGRCVRAHRPRPKHCKKGMRLVKGRCVRVHKRGYGKKY